MVRTQPYGSDNRIDVSRILGYATAIALHALALLLLLIPMTAPQVGQVAKQPDTTYRWIYPEKKPPPKIEPDTVQVIKKQPDKPKTAEIVNPVVPTTDQQAITDNDARLVDTQASADTDTGTTAGPVSSGPISVATLGYGDATPPPYPRVEMRAGIQGTVVLKVLVDTDGTPLEVVVQTSSGNRNLDRSASQHVLKRWRFQPAMKDGQPVQAYGLVPIVFSLQ